MWDSSIEDFEVILAARDAEIHETVMQRDGGCNAHVSEGGYSYWPDAKRGIGQMICPNCLCIFDSPDGDVTCPACGYPEKR